MTTTVAVLNASTSVGASLLAILDCTNARDREQARSYEGTP